MTDSLCWDRDISNTQKPDALLTQNNDLYIFVDRGPKLKESNQDTSVKVICKQMNC